VWKILEDITRMQVILAQKIGRVREESNPAPPSEWIVSRPETTDCMNMSTPLVLPGESELNPGTASWGMTIGHIAQKDLSNLASETDPSQYRMSAVAVPPSSPQHPRISDRSAPEDVAQALLDLRNREYGVRDISLGNQNSCDGGSGVMLAMMMITTMMVCKMVITMTVD